MAFDTHAAVKALTAAGAGALAELAEAVVDIARDASTESAKGRELATKADLVALEARLAWRASSQRVSPSQASPLPQSMWTELTVAVLRLLA